MAEVIIQQQLVSQLRMKGKAYQRKDKVTQLQSY